MDERPRLRALLRLPELLRLLDAAAGPGGQLPAADRRLGVRRRRLLPADLLLVPAHDRDQRRHQGVRDQRRRRRRARARHVLHLQAHRHARLPQARSTRSTQRVRRATTATLVAGCLLLLVGAFAKSAQVPLHTWLPDAMEGPTPVSALIHAATMVTAGVYLIARMHPLFEQAPAAADVGAIVGCVDAADRRHDRRSCMTDLKRVIAYSTMSQIGYMIMAVSVGRLRRRAVPPDDARLLQGAAVHGAPARSSARWPASSRSTGWAASARRCRSRSAASSIGGLALSGVPPFSGFFSKDEILAVRRRARRLATGRSYVARLRRRVPDRRSTRSG